ncbi:lysophospholipid acyltransferase family protein [Flavobacterium crassostreae]|uniref:Lipid A biosynthesis acyltransferase n=1 Tax=Flavobacterium crassostreae TaxID=1763534 RepID=A0A1B9E9H0_9FLAO|nr:lysophospholipid acyltransferase family protein [Flavobacterium crassostreae]OCB78594.1 lipid A biosynthesis acyltransferase [Flavobacterium crassostreae]
MQFLVFLIAYPLLWLVSILPFPVFYALSDVLYFLMYYVVGYRKKTVKANLALALPNRTDQERLQIEKKFYHHLCDLFLEMTKTMTMSSTEMNKRFVITNPELLKEYEKKGKSIMLLASHYASWEWLITLNLNTSFQGVGVYKKLSNKYFDTLIKDIRSKYNTQLVVTRETIALISSNQKKGILSIYGLASDQSPKNDRISHWDYFMGVEVPVHTGAEMLAKKYDLSVLFAKVEKTKRGHYKATLIPLSDHPKLAADFDITHRFIQEVEKQIYQAPEYYFWTHKRWKHQR